MNELALFAGAGGGILGGETFGWRPVCAVEINAFGQRVLLARQNDRRLRPFPIWDDVRTFDGLPWRGIVDMVSGGFPCQDVSDANPFARGLAGLRSGLWSHQKRIIGDVRPGFAFVENSPRLTCRGGLQVVGDLTALGYDVRWTTLGGDEAGLDADGQRMWILAKAPGERWARVLQTYAGSGEQAFRNARQAENANPPTIADRVSRHEVRCGEPALVGKSHGMAYPVDELGAIGNGQHPRLLELALLTLANN